MPARSVCLVALSLSEAGPGHGRFGRQVSVIDIYHTIPYHTFRPDRHIGDGQLIPPSTDTRDLQQNIIKLKHSDHRIRTANDQHDGWVQYSITPAVTLALPHLTDTTHIRRIFVYTHMLHIAHTASL